MTYFSKSFMPTFQQLSASQTPDILVTGPRCEQLTGVKRSSRYEKLSPSSPRYDATFPRPIKVGARAIRFSQNALLKWVQQKTEESQLNHTPRTDIGLTTFGEDA